MLCCGTIKGLEPKVDFLDSPFKFLMVGTGCHDSCQLVNPTKFLFAVANQAMCQAASQYAITNIVPNLL